MKSKFAGAIAVAAFAGISLMGVHEVRADLLNFGTTYTNNLTDFATGTPLNNTITLSSNAQSFLGGALIPGTPQITETTYTIPSAGGAEFVEFDISIIGGGPLVSNGNSLDDFQIDLNNIQLTAPAVSSNYYFDFATNGVTNTPIYPPLSGQLGVETNPNPGSSFAGKNTFYFPGFTSGPATTTGYAFDLGSFLEYVLDLNIDPNATDYIVGWELSSPVGPVGVPGPVAGAGLPGIVFATGGLLAWWRRKRTGALAA